MNGHKYILLLLLLTVSFRQNNTSPLVIQSKSVINIPEPSDICLSADGKNLYIVSDRGYLYITDLNLVNIKKINLHKKDAEAVFANEKYIYIMEERSRTISVYDAKTYDSLWSKKLYFEGKYKNHGFESLTYNPIRKIFIAVSEKHPMQVWELDEELNQIKIIPISGAKDISSATWYQNKLYFLSDEDSKIMEVDPVNYTIKKEWYLGIENPEGICFLSSGQFIIVCDEISTMYKYSQLP